MYFPVFPVISQKIRLIPWSSFANYIFLDLECLSLTLRRATAPYTVERYLQSTLNKASLPFFCCVLEFAIEVESIRVRARFKLLHNQPRFFLSVLTGTLIYKFADMHFSQIITAILYNPTESIMSTR